MSVSNGQFTRTYAFGPEAERNYPRFFLDSVEDPRASVEAGRPIFRDEERVEIIMPGNPYTRPVQRVTDDHRRRWPKEYEAFKAGQQISAEGTPLEHWPRLKRSQVLELKALGFQTVEHVAKMDDQAIGRVGMGGRQLRDLARAFLDDAAHAAEVERLADANTRKDAELDALRRQVDDLRRTLDGVETDLQIRQAPPPAAGAADAGGVAAVPAGSALASLDGAAARPRPPREQNKAVAQKATQKRVLIMRRASEMTPAVRGPAPRSSDGRFAPPAAAQD